MIQEILSVFKPAKLESKKIFFIGETVSIRPEYYRATNSNSFDTPIYGWTVRSINGPTATITRGVLHSTHKLYIDTNYLKSE